jgi:hypothetical protein
VVPNLGFELIPYISTSVPFFNIDLVGKNSMKKILIALFIIIGLFVILILGIWLSVDFQSVTHEIFRGISKRINGKLEIGSIEPGVPGKVILRNLLLTKAGKEILEIPEFEIHLSLVDLFQFKTRLESLIVRNPKLHLEWKDQQWNVADIFEPKPIVPNANKDLSLVTIDPGVSGLKGLKVDRLEVRSADIEIIKDSKNIKLRVGLEGQLENALLKIGSWLIIMGEDSEIRGEANLNLIQNKGRLENIKGRLQPASLQSLLSLMGQESPVTIQEAIEIEGSATFDPGNIVPSLEVKAPSLSLAAINPTLKLHQSSWNILGDTIQGEWELDTALGNLKGNAKANWKTKIAVTEFSGDLVSTLEETRLGAQFATKVSVKVLESKSLEFNGITTLKGGSYGENSLVDMELASQVQFVPDSGHLQIQRAILDFPGSPGRVEMRGQVPLDSFDLNNLNLNISGRNLNLKALVPLDLPSPPTEIERVSAQLKKGILKIDTGTGKTGSGRFHIAGQIPLEARKDALKDLRVHIEKVDLRFLDPRLKAFKLDYLDLTRDGRINARINGPGTSKLVLGAEASLSKSPFKDVMLMGQMNLSHLKPFLPGFSQKLPSGLINFGLSGKTHRILKGTLGSKKLSIPVTEGIDNLDLRDLLQTVKIDLEKEEFSISKGSARILEGKANWSGILDLKNLSQSQFKAGYTSGSLDRSLSHFVPLMKSHSSGSVDLSITDIKILEDTEAYPISLKGSATIKNPQYFYHQTLHDLLDGVSTGLSQNLLKGLVQGEIDQQAARSSDGVDLKDIKNLSFRFDGLNLSFSPFKLEEARDEFQFDFSSLNLKIPSKPEEVGSVAGTLGASLSAPFLKKHLPLKDSFSQSFRRDIVLEGPMSMPLSESTISSLKKDLIALAIRHTDFKEVGEDLELKAKSIKKEAKQALRDIKSLFKGSPATPTKTGTKTDNLNLKVQEIKDAKKAVKGLLKGLFGR